MRARFRAVFLLALSPLASCGKTSPTPASTPLDAGAAASGAGSLGPPATSTTAPTTAIIKARGQGCWGAALPDDEAARVAQLEARCAAGYRTLLTLRALGPATPLDVSIPANTCVRFLLVGPSVRATLERADGTAAATSAGPADAILPEQGPYCTAKGERLRLRTSDDARAVVLVSP